MSLTSLTASSPLSSNSLAADARSLNSLNLQAGKTTPAAIKETAKQFESLFMRELIKSMREATMKSGLLDSPGENLGTDLLDQQLSVSLSGLPGGLSDLIAKQLAKQSGVPDPTTSNTAARGTGPNPSAAPANAPIIKGGTSPTSQADFIRQHQDAAKNVEKTSGIPSAIMIGQAGHESGWGKKPILNADGSNSFNLFGIKAGAGWTGKVASISTTEYVNGKAQTVTAKFRAYNSFQESFQDYARLINSSPRYAQARTQTASVQGFTSELQKAGYATDPAYAAKLSRAINATLQVQRGMA